MFFDLFRRRARVVKVDNEKTEGQRDRKSRWLIFGVGMAILVLAFGSCNDDKKTKEVKPVEEKGGFSEYIEAVEAELEDTLSRIKGAGSVEVMLTFEAMDEKVLAVNKKGSLESSVEESGSANKSSNEEEIFVVGSGSAEQPYVLKEKLPVPTGVLVTATGAESESVRLELYEAVKALFGISGHRIKIATARGK